MSIFQLVVSRPVAVWMIAIAAAVFGFVSYQRLPLDLMPDLAYPSITVRTEAEGYAPEEVEGQVSRPVEEALATTEGLVELESRSRASLSDVVLEFAWGSDMDRAAQDVRERLQTTFLPDDVGRPLILRYDPSLDPILRISLSADAEGSALPDDDALALLALRELAERELKRELEAMDGVAAVQVRGGLEREVLVEARQDWLAARGVTMQQLITALGTENVNLPGGSIRDGDQEFMIRTLNEVRSVDEIEKLEIRRPDGVGVPISELAVVSESHKDREVVSRLAGQPAVTLEVYKTADANIVRVARDIKERLGAGRPELPPGMDPAMVAAMMGPPALADQLPDGVRMVVLEDQAEFIEASLNNLRNTALLGAVLAVGVLFLFLRDLRATLIIGAAIPLSVIVTFAPMYLGGVSLNLMSLGGLALGIGMLVDNAVVVLENIQVHLDRGATRKDAAVVGAKEVAAAVTASTLTTVSVFLPIAFVEGIAGQIFGDLSLAVVFSLLASLVVALFFVPVLAAADLDLARLTDTPAHQAEPGLRGTWRALMQSGRATRFASWPQLKQSLRTRSGWRRWVVAPYLLLRFLLRLCFELGAFFFMVPAALIARTVLGLASLVLPRLHRAALWLADRFQAAYGRFAGRYDASMDTVLRRGSLVLGIAALTVAASLPLSLELGQALIPEVHQGRFTAELALPVGTPLPRTSRFSREIEERLADLPGISHVHAVVGSERRADSGSDEGEHTARISVELAEGGGDLAAREDRMMEQVRGIVADVARGELSASARDALPDQRPGTILAAAGVELRLVRPSIFSFRTPIEVIVYDDDLPALRSWSDHVTATLTGLTGLTDVRSSLTEGYPEVRIRYDRDLLERFGLDTGTVARRVREQVQGQRATTLSRRTGRIDLTVRLVEDERRSVDDLRRINVNPQLSPPIPLEAVAWFDEAEGPSEIRRIDQRRAAVVTANIEGFDLSGQAKAIGAALTNLKMPAGSWEIAGQNREMERSLTSLQLALGLAVFLVYVIMASTFESVLHPFVILFSVPLALVGVVAALLLTGTPVSVVVLIGAIVLAGVVVNNAIVMVDTINRHRAAGAARAAAVHKASVLRLRPILITTTTTVLGLLPLALGLGEGAEVQQPLAVTVIAGLSSSTLLTLVVIPVVYLQLTARLERRARGPSPAAATPDPEPGK